MRACSGDFVIFIQLENPIIGSDRNITVYFCCRIEKLVSHIWVGDSRRVYGKLGGLNRQIRGGAANTRYLLVADVVRSIVVVDGVGENHGNEWGAALAVIHYAVLIGG